MTQTVKPSVSNIVYTQQKGQDFKTVTYNTKTGHVNVLKNVSFEGNTENVNGIDMLQFQNH